MKKTFAKVCYWSGQACLTLLVILFFISIGLIWYNHGYLEMMKVVSPFNVIGWLTLAVSAAPGIFLLWASDKLGYIKNS